MIQERIIFKNRNNYELTGIVQLPDKKPTAFALFAHGFTCSKNMEALGYISDSLVKSGMGVLRFDFTGLGESEGDFSDTNFSSNIEDLVDAGKYLEKHFEAPSILIGHSLGGAAVLAAAGEIKSCLAVVTIAAPSSPDHVLRHIANLDEIEKLGIVEVNIAGRKFNIKKQFLEDLDKQSLRNKIKNLGRPLLIMHSPQDTFVGINNATEIFTAAKHPKSFISLDNADHILSDPSDSSNAGFIISSWVGKYIVDTDYQKDDKFVRLNGSHVAVATDLSGFFSTINAGGHYYYADEPISAGGTDNGPSPYELLLAALGSCTNITLKMYADRKQISLEKVVSRLKYEKIHAEDCRDCETETGKIDRIEKEMEFIGDLTPEQVQRLFEISERCPVHRTLNSEVSIISRLKN